jgi:hypothetical protein
MKEKMNIPEIKGKRFIIELQKLALVLPIV